MKVGSNINSKLILSVIENCKDKKGKKYHQIIFCDLPKGLADILGIGINEDGPHFATGPYCRKIKQSRYAL